jgi:predicted amidohydrolase
METAMIEAWRATCIQVTSTPAAAAGNREAARAIIAANVGRALKLIEAACDGATPPRLVVLPEFALQGPPRGDSIATWIDKACDTLPGEITAPFQALARRRGIFIAGNMFEIDPKWAGRFFNCCFLIDPRGEVILRFRRINTAVWPSPHDFMDDYVAELGPDGVFPVVETELGRLAMIACGEIAVPEIARVLMMRGAEVILHPTNEAASPAQEAAKIARAAENMVYLISADVAGPIGFSVDGSVLGGRSHIIDFRGDSLAFEASAAETIGVSALLDIEKLRLARNDLGMGNTLLRQRWEMYRPYFRDWSVYPPNQFLAKPMPDAAATAPVARAALDKLIAAGVVIPPAEVADSARVA